MNIEVEIKVRVSSFHHMDEKIMASGMQLVRSFDKSDRYFHLMHGKQVIHEVRLRQDEGSCVVTQKNKSISHGLEKNEEREFTVSHPEDMEFLLEKSGYVLFIEKRKVGNAYRTEEYLLELSRIEGLGCFLEIERVLPPRAREKEISSVEKQIRAIMSDLGVSEADVEHRPYTAMLAEQWGISDPRQS